jgi:hypothetical protein
LVDRLLFFLPGIQDNVWADRSQSSEIFPARRANREMVVHIEYK